jgi:spiro-SPASM protein
MAKLEYNPSNVSIYLAPEVGKYYSSVSPNHRDLFQSKFLESMDALFPGIEIIINYQVPSLNERWTILEAKTELEFFHQVLSRLPESSSPIPEWDEVCFLYFTGFAPLLDVELTKTIWDRHKKYLSQYSYSENLPPGIVPKILTREFIVSLPSNLNQESHCFFIKNINNYDVEIFYHPPDLRQYRLSFFPNDGRSSSFVSSILKDIPEGELFTYDGVLDRIYSNPEIFRSAPSYIELEIYRGCELSCTFCPRQAIDNSEDGRFIELAQIQKIIQELDGFGSSYTIALGGMGEPLHHPNISEILNSIAEAKQITEVIVESALYLEPEKIDTILNGLTRDSLHTIKFIINLTSLKAERYSKIYGKNLLSQVKDNITKLLTVFPKENIAVQILKIKEVEDEVDAYFTYFEKLGLEIVFQKYNRYTNLLPEKRVSNLTPLKREFCWHLARDLYINADGSVSLCKQYPNPVADPKTQILGNIKNQSLVDIWAQGADHFHNSLLGSHVKIPAACLNCDEWYSFNA